MWNPFKKKEKSDAEKLAQHIKEIPLEELTGLFDGLNDLSEIYNAGMQYQLSYLRL